MNWNVPNIPIALTLIRLLLSPLLLPITLAHFLPQNIPMANYLLALIFLFFSATDFFDGFLARHYGKVTRMGKILDPIADKFLIFSTIITLVALGKFYFYWAIIIVGREFFVMALREVAAHYKFSVPVSIYGKAKTMSQMLMLTIVILNSSNNPAILNPINLIEKTTLAISLFLTIISALFYAYQFQIRLKTNTTN